MRAFTTVAALSAFTLVSALNGTEFTIDPTEITLTERGMHPIVVVFLHHQKSLLTE